MILQEILKGYQLAMPQVVGHMRVVPIITDTPFTKVTGMENVYLKKDVTYNQLIMSTREGEIAIIPQGLMYVTQKGAQDRALPSAQLIRGDKKIDVDCLEPEQGGLMRAQEQREYGLLPYTLKAKALQYINDGEYDSLWNDITEFMRQSGVPGRAIYKFFKRYVKELETFVAQFEPIDMQVGAIFVINNEILGLEIAPNYETWNLMWRPIVRDCYGAEAVARLQQGAVAPEAGIALKNDTIETIEDLENVLVQMKQQELGVASEILSTIGALQFEKESLQVLEDFELFSFTSNDFVGQGVQHGPERFVYLSLMIKNRVKRAAPARTFDARWNENDPYKNDEQCSTR